MMTKDEKEKKLAEVLEKIDERLVKLLLLRIKVASTKELLRPYDKRYKKSYDKPNMELSDKAKKLAQVYWKEISKGDLKKLYPGSTIWDIFVRLENYSATIFMDDAV